MDDPLLLCVELLIIRYSLKCNASGILSRTEMCTQILLYLDRVRLSKKQFSGNLDELGAAQWLEVVDQATRMHWKSYAIISQSAPASFTHALLTPQNVFSAVDAIYTEELPYFLEALRFVINRSILRGLETVDIISIVDR